MESSLEPRSFREFEFREIRGATAQADYARLLDRAFPVPEGASFFDDFPIWDESNGGPIYRLGAYLGPKIVSGAGLRFGNLKLGTRGISCAIVGGVATDSAQLGRGLASELVSRLIQVADRQNTQLLLLWSSDENLYSRLGFRFVGKQVRVALSDLKLSASSGDFELGWDDSILSLLSKREGGLAFTDNDAKWIRAHKNIQWWYAGTPARAYAAFGKGIDLDGFVHEWGGEPRALASLLSVIRETHPQAQLLGHPGILARAGLMASSFMSEPLCLACVKDPALVTPADLEQIWVWGLDSA